VKNKLTLHEQCSHGAFSSPLLSDAAFLPTLPLALPCGGCCTFLPRAFYSTAASICGITVLLTVVADGGLKTFPLLALYARACAQHAWHLTRHQPHVALTCPALANLLPEPLSVCKELCCDALSAGAYS